MSNKNKQKMSMVIPFKKFFWFSFLTGGLYIVFYMYRIWKHLKNNPLDTFEKDSRNENTAIKGLFWILYLNAFMKRAAYVKDLVTDSENSNYQKTANIILLIIILPAVLILSLQSFEFISITGIIIYKGLIMPLLLILGTYFLKKGVEAFNLYFINFEKNQVYKKRVLHWWEYLVLIFGILNLLQDLSSLKYLSQSI